MAEPTIQLGGGNWAGKTDNLLGYYKEGERFYKQDFTFSRSTTGTYTDSDGYIQEMPYNLLEQSNQFDTTWGNTNSLESLDTSVLAPNGKYTAWKLQANSGTHYSFLSQTVTISGQVSFTVFIKKGTANTATMYLSESGNFGLTANLENGTITSVTGSNMVGSVESVGNGWYRFEIRHTTNDNLQNTVRIGIEGGSFGSVTYDGTENIYIYGAQVVKGTSAKTYFPTTTRLNMPRVSYLNNSNGSLILEPQRTNLVTQSEDFSGYSGGTTTIVINQATAPDGTTSADKIYPTASGNFVGKYLNIGASTTGVVSCFVKQANKRYAILGTDNSTYSCIFDLQTGTVSSEATNYTAKIENYGNGWYRISAAYTDSAAAPYPFIGVADSTNGSVTKDGTNGLFIWGFQYELNASYPTSYIPTSGSSVTRNADACSITNVADRIGQTEGVIFVDFELQTTGEDFVIMNLYNTSSPANGIYFYLNYSRFLNAYCDNGGNQVLIASGVLSEGRFKAAFAYKENDFAFYLNGSLIGVDNSGTVPTCGALRLENYQNSPTYQEKTKVYQAQIYNTRLSNSELATLTT